MTKNTNVAYERYVLAGIIKYGLPLWTEIEYVINIHCFSLLDNQLIFTALQKLLESSSSIDIPSILGTLKLNGVDKNQDKDFIVYLTQMFNFGVSENNVIANAKIINKLRIIREAKKLARETFYSLEKLNGTEKVDEIISTIEGPFSDFSSSVTSVDKDETKLIADDIEDYYEYLKTEQPKVLGIPSNLKYYNEAIGGGRRRGYVYLIGARPKTGKTQSAINDAIFCASNNVEVLYLDTEMSQKDGMSKMIACLSDVQIKTVETGGFVNNTFEHRKVQDAVNKLKKLPISYRKISGMTFDEVLPIIRKWVLQKVGKENGVTRNCIVIYDYFKLMDTSELNDLSEFQAIGFQISKLSDFCGKYDIPCSAYVQLNRDGITKDSTDIISQSDRLLWLCASFAFLRRKTSEEMEEEEFQYGNTKMVITQDQRFGPGLDDGEYLNLDFKKDRSIIKEIGLRSQMIKNESRKQDSASF